MYHFDLRALQMKELEILKEVDRICKKHNITYFLAYGTCIGAVRHQGFIPWDDDIDITMKFNDYIKFKKIAIQEMDPKYFYQDYLTDPNVPYCWAKIRDSSTCSMIREMSDFPINWGVCIDIFPLLPIKGNRLNRLDSFCLKMIHLCVHKQLNQYGYGEFGITSSKLKYLPSFMCKKLSPLLFRILLRKRKGIDHYLSIESIKDGFFKKEIFDECKLTAFEDCYLPIPKGYDDYLTAYYGDYMKVPDVHEQENHGDIIVDLDQSYVNYMKVR